MTRLIDADKLFDALETDKVNLIQSGYNADQISGLNMALCSINIAPTVDAAPVVHGRWEDKPTGRYGQQQSWCSACRKPSGIGGTEKNRHRAYCPNCGAKMD